MKEGEAVRRYAAFLEAGRSFSTSHIPIAWMAAGRDVFTTNRLA